METGVEPFSSPHYCTRRSIRRYSLNHSRNDAITPLPVPFGSTPTFPSLPNATEDKPTSPPTAHDTTQLSDREKREGPRTESQGHAASPESVSVDGGHAVDCVDQCTEDDAEGTACPGKCQAEENQGFTNHTDDTALPKSPSFSCQLERTFEEASDTSTAPHYCDDPDPGTGAAVLCKESPAEETNKCCEPHTSPCVDTINQKSFLHHSVQSQLLLSPPLASTLSTIAHHHSSTLLFSPTLPSLGVTPQSVPDALPLTSSPSAPNLVLPPPHSPSTQALSPPPLSPCQPPAATDARVQALCHLVLTAESANDQHGSNIQSEGERGLKTGAEEEALKSCTQTLKVTGCIRCSQNAVSNQIQQHGFLFLCVSLPTVSIWWLSRRCVLSSWIFR